MIFCPICHQNIDELTENCNHQKWIDELKTGEVHFHPEIQANHGDYDANNFKKLFEFENKHFWFVNRKKLILKLFKKYVKKDAHIIEVGAGTGDIIRYLKANDFHQLCVGELHKEGLKYAKSYGIEKRYQFDILKTPFENEFDAIGMFDVIEHIEEDNLVVKNAHKMLKKDGVIFITVPANMWLWNSHDAIAKHKRRYAKRELIELFNHNGFNVLDCNFFYFSILPLLFLRKLLSPDNEKNSSHNSTNITFSYNKLINSILTLVTSVEIFFLPKMIFPTGGSLYLVARKN
jgi:SAM-dependent methyltransferase